MTTIKEEHASSSKLSDDVPTDDSVKGNLLAGRKRRYKGSRNITEETLSAGGEASRKSSRRRVTPKTYLEETSSSVSRPRQQKTQTGQWKEDELERLLDSLKTLQSADKVHSVKKHVKTKNIKQIEAKIEALKKKALDKALEDTIGMPPLQCWENLAQDINSTLSDEGYREISKVFQAALAEPSASRDDHTQAKKSDRNQPNYNRINSFIAALLRGTPADELNELSPIDAMILLECLNNTIELLHNINMHDEHADFLRKRYTYLFYKLYAPKSLTKSGSELSNDNNSNGPSTSQLDEEESTRTVSGLGTLNPFNIPVDKLNLIRPEACDEHGNLYCSIIACRNKQVEKQKTMS